MLDEQERHADVKAVAHDTQAEPDRTVPLWQTQSQPDGTKRALLLQVEHVVGLVQAEHPREQSTQVEPLKTLPGWQTQLEPLKTNPEPQVEQAVLVQVVQPVGQVKQKVPAA